MNNKPKLRFPGFTDAWEQRKLGDEFERVNERNNGQFGITHWISVAKMYYQEPDKVQSNNLDTRTYVMRKGDIAFEGHPNSEFQFGRFVANDIGDGIISELFPIYRHKLPYENSYWKYAIQLERVMRPIYAKAITSSGASSNKLNEEHFLRESILVPQLDEQRAIGAFFISIDNLITLHQRKLESIKEYKRGMLQKMFPKEGEDIPEVRFPGFTDAWEQRKLSDITSKIGSGKTPLGGKEAYVDDGICLIRSQNVYDDKVDLSDVVYIDEKIDNSMSNSRVIAGDVLLNITGASIGRSAVYTEIKSANVNQHVCIIRPVEGFESKYIQLNLASNNGQKQIDASQAGGGREGLNFQQIGKMEFMFPKIEEQKKIGAFFSNIDNLITLHQRKLDELKEYKQGLLQQMFA